MPVSDVCVCVNSMPLYVSVSLCMHESIARVCEVSELQICALVYSLSLILEPFSPSRCPYTYPNIQMQKCIHAQLNLRVAQLEVALFQERGKQKSTTFDL